MKRFHEKYFQFCCNLFTACALAVDEAKQPPQNQYDSEWRFPDEEHAQNGLTGRTHSRHRTPPGCCRGTERSAEVSTLSHRFKVRGKAQTYAPEARQVLGPEVRPQVLTKMRSQVCSQVRCEMPTEELVASALTINSPDGSTSRLETHAARLVTVFSSLAKRKRHLLYAVLQNEAPVQWGHYPDNDAVDSSTGYQWFYHSHSPEDRPDTTEHGHFHLFARRKLWARRMNSSTEKTFAVMTRDLRKNVETRHLLTIGLNANGLPISLFTVNSWVTGDLMLSASLTEELLREMRLNTGYPEIDAVIESVVALCPEELRTMLELRDQSLANCASKDILSNKKLELLSEVPINLDAKL